MNSERLPGKVMKPIGGIPMIGILINRLSQSKLPIVLATSINKENDVLAEYVQSLGVTVYRGSEDNVLERYYYAAKKLNAQTIIRVTGDNPLLDGVFLKENVDYYFSLKDERAYLSTSLSQTFPIGFSVEIFSMTLLEEAYRNANHPGEFEHVTPYMYKNQKGNIKVIKVSRPDNKYHYRLTVDTPEDFMLNAKLIEEYGCDKKNLEEIIRIIDENPALINLNQSSIQKNWDE